MTEPGFSRPRLEDVLEQAIEARLLGVNTSLPGVVVSFDGAKNTCVVQPACTVRYDDDTVVPLPQVFDVPVAYPRAGKLALTFPLRPGDTVLLIFAQRSLDRFLSLGGVQDPRDTRKHDLTDAIAIPGVYPKSAATEVPAEGVLLKADKARVEMREAGKFRLQAEGGDELLTEVAAIAQSVRDLATAHKDLAGHVTTIGNAVKDLVTGLLPLVYAPPPAGTAAEAAGGVAGGGATGATAAGAAGDAAGAAAATSKGKVVGITG